MFVFSYLKYVYYLRKSLSVLTRIKNLESDAMILELRKLKQSILEFHFLNNLYFKDRNNLESFSWSKIKILKKSDLDQLLINYISESVKMSDCYISSTSGSSGHPFYFVKDKSAHAFTWANILLQHKNLGITTFSKQARFYGIPATGISKIKERIKDLLMNRLRFNVFNLTDTAFSKWLEIFSNTKFVYINGYTSVIALFARYCIKNKLILNQICPSLKLCIVTSETCTLEDKEIIMQAFGVPVVREYGASEIDLIAIEGLDGVWRICESNVYVEIVDDEGNILPDGEEGRILVTSLYNKAMPFIRYEIGDRGILGLSDKGERILVQLTGRTNDMVHLPSGKKAAGLTFYYISRTLLEKGGFLKEFIIRQKKLNFFEFDIVADRELTTKELASIQDAMDTYLEQGLKFQINRVPFIERKGSGKIKHFFSELELSKTV